MHYIIGNLDDVLWVALKALLLYLTAVIGFRLGERRTLSQLSPFDFVAAIAVGAIVGRVPNAQDGSYLGGMATLLTVLLAHAAVTRLRLRGGLADRPPLVLVADGVPVDAALRSAGLRRDDLDAILRQHGILHVAAVRYLIFESRGQTSVIRRGDETLEGSTLQGLVAPVPQDAPGGRRHPG